MTRVEERYLGQSIREFVENGGDARDYAELVFAGEVFGSDDPTDAELEVFTADDLAAELEHLIAQDARLRALEAHREGTQFKPLDAASPSVLLQARVPRVLLDRVTAAAVESGVSRSEWIRAALEQRLAE